jgi:hypothetical protein
MCAGVCICIGAWDFVCVTVFEWTLAVVNCAVLCCAVLRCVELCCGSLRAHGVGTGVSPPQGACPALVPAGRTRELIVPWLSCGVSLGRLEGAIRVSVHKKRFYKPSRLLTFTLPFGTIARYVRCVA